MKVQNKRAVPVQMAPLWISQPRNQNQSISQIANARMHIRSWQYSRVFLLTPPAPQWRRFQECRYDSFPSFSDLQALFASFFKICRALFQIRGALFFRSCKSDMKDTDMREISSAGLHLFSRYAGLFFRYAGLFYGYTEIIQSAQQRVWTLWKADIDILEGIREYVDTDFFRC